jgi:hypothetical protein
MNEDTPVIACAVLRCTNPRECEDCGCCAGCCDCDLNDEPDTEG